MTYQELMDTEKSDFRKYLNSMIQKIPVDVNDMEFECYRRVLSRILIETCNHLTELTSIYAVAQGCVRMAKTEKDKEKTEDYIYKRDLAKVYMDAVKETNKTVSRIITLKQMELEELKSLDVRRGNYE